MKDLSTVCNGSSSLLGGSDATIINAFRTNINNIIGHSRHLTKLDRIQEALHGYAQSSSSSFDNDNHSSVIPFSLLHQDTTCKYLLDMDWSKSKIDYSDNKAQLDVIKHHYDSEFGGSGSCIDEVVKDYKEDSVIHKVIDEQPTTYHGRAGARQAINDMFSFLQWRSPITNTATTSSASDVVAPHPENIRLQHIAVNNNHAQVIWNAETATHDKTIVGTDSFTFDPSDNRIRSQTTVALSSPEETAAVSPRRPAEDDGKGLVQTE